MEYSSKEVWDATCGFAKDAMIGAGGYATVYRAKLRGKDTAVKRLRPEVETNEMKKELSFLKRTKHPNVVGVLGTCLVERCLVYELMERGSLETWLKGIRKRMHLTLRLRIQLLKQVAGKWTGHVRWVGACLLKRMQALVLALRGEVST